MQNCDTSSSSWLLLLRNRTQAAARGKADNSSRCQAEDTRRSSVSCPRKGGVIPPADFSENRSMNRAPSRSLGERPSQCGSSPPHCYPIASFPRAGRKPRTQTRALRTRAAEHGVARDSVPTITRRRSKAARRWVRRSIHRASRRPPPPRPPLATARTFRSCACADPRCPGRSAMRRRSSAPLLDLTMARRTASRVQSTRSAGRTQNSFPAPIR